MAQFPTLLQVTPVLIVETVEPCVAFWARLGFKTLAEVPHEGKLGFAMLGDGKLTVMYQSLASVNADLAASGALPDWLFEGVQQSHLFVTVADLAVVESVLSDLPIAMPRRKTFYGALETGYLDPAGHFVLFAQFEPETPEDPGL